MPTLHPPRKERFAALLASGLNAIKAYAEAGYKPDPRGKVCFRLRHRPEVEARVEELLNKHSRPNIEARATERAIERLALSKEIVARELSLIAFANMSNYTRLVGDERVPDFSGTTYDQMAAVSEINVEYFAPPPVKVGDGKGVVWDLEGQLIEQEIRAPGAPGPIKRARFKLGDKRQALMDIAKLFGWVVEKREDVTKLEERLRAMTPEQREAEAHALYDRTKARLLQDRREREARGEIVDEAGRTVGMVGGIGEPSQE